MIVLLCVEGNPCRRDAVSELTDLSNSMMLRRGLASDTWKFWVKTSSSLVWGPLFLA